MASAAFEEARANPEAQMAGGVTLVFPAFDDLPVKTVHFGTRRFEADGEDYEPALADMPYLRTQRGLAQDGLSFSVTDASADRYEDLKPYEDVIEDTEVVSKEFLKTRNDIFESEIIFNGTLEQMALSDASLSINFSSVSDMSRAGILTGGRILTQRYCAAIFHKYGVLSALLSKCGWQLEQGGNPLSCTHKYEGPGGCLDHNNGHRYYAVEALTSAEIQIYTPEGNGTGGWNYGGGGNLGGSCFTPKTLIWMADGSYKPIWKIKEGDLVWSFKPNGELVKARVKATAKHLVDGHLSVDFGRGRILEPTFEHPFLIAPDLFQEIGALDAGNTVRSQNKRGEWFNFLISDHRHTEKRTRVHDISIEEWETFFAVCGDMKVGVHNKPPLDQY